MIQWYIYNDIYNLYIYTGQLQLETSIQPSREAILSPGP